VLKETGRVIAIKEDSLWVETIKRSTCGSCAAEKGCGQTLLQKIGANPTYLRIPFEYDSTRRYHLNDSVTIGIPNDIIVKGSLFLYLLPLTFLLALSGVAHTFSSKDFVSILAGIMGFTIGCLLIRWHSYHYRNDKRHQACLVEDDLVQDDLIQEINVT
jgi:sigma-E factor negative regulatory protein RseC